WNFTIADSGSGQYSSEIGVITGNVLELANQPPNANAGGDVNLELPNEDIGYDLPVYLNGAASSDNTGDIIYYFWEILRKPFGSNAEINTQNTDTPSAILTIPNELDSAGYYELKLTVTDEYGLSDEDTMNVTITKNLGNG